MNYTTIDGVRCYAPEFALQNDDYPKEAFSILFELEEDNFWFRSRNSIIAGLLKKHSPDMDKFLEIGCGTGFVISNLQKNFPAADFYGSEIYLEGIKFARKRLPEVNFIQLDATKMPFENEFAAIGAFDVLEHIEDDLEVMKGVYKALKPGGKFYISVPQHRFLWSINDDIAFHKRRYSRNEMLTKLKAAGFQVDYATSFVFTLFPAMLFSRIAKGKAQDKVDKETIIKTVKDLKVGKLTNTLFSALMKIDEKLIAGGTRLPFGGSLMVVAKKQ